MSRAFDADLVIIGIGIVPNVELAADAGLAVRQRHRRRRPLPHRGCEHLRRRRLHQSPQPAARTDALRLESVPNAMEQARVAAANLCGGDKVYASVPWFWSDQYDLKLQMVGFAADGDTEVLRGDKSANSFAVFHLKDGAIAAVDAVNSPKEFMICRRLVGREVDAKKLSNPRLDLKSLLWNHNPSVLPVRETKQKQTRYCNTSFNVITEGYRLLR